jgi:uncharacterized repeat protein (TIGR03803 family)
MKFKAWSIGFEATFAILTLALFATGTCAVAQDETLLYSFGSHLKDGKTPIACLIFDGSGNLYGTTSTGGPDNGGIVFELTPTSGGGWTETLLHNFNHETGAELRGGLIFDGAGDLYGTTSGGGAHDSGTVFELTPKTGGGWKNAVLHTFNGTDGANPAAALIFDAAGNLYGTATAGGAHNHGTVFELMPKSGGGWNEKVLHNFNTNGKDGNNPRSSLIFDAAGNLYGTTVSPYGTAFELMPEARGPWTLKALHIFNFNGTDGVEPYAGLIFDAAGNLYGTTSGGGAHDSGTVFEITP